MVEEASCDVSPSPEADDVKEAEAVTSAEAAVEDCQHCGTVPNYIFAGVQRIDIFFGHWRGRNNAILEAVIKLVASVAFPMSKNIKRGWNILFLVPFL